MLLPAFEGRRNSNALASSASVCVLDERRAKVFFSACELHNDWTDYTYILDITLVAFLVGNSNSMANV